MEAADFATFMVAEDAPGIVAAFNRLHGPARATFVAHLQVIASMQDEPRGQTRTDARLLIAASPEARGAMMRTGPLISGSPQGRVVERHKRAHKLTDIVRAEFPDMDPVEGLRYVREILEAARKDLPLPTEPSNTGKAKTKHLLNSRGGPRVRAPGQVWLRRPAEMLQPLKDRAVELRKLGVGTSVIAKEIGERPGFVTTVLTEARQKGTTFPDIDVKAKVPDHLKGRPATPSVARKSA